MRPNFVLSPVHSLREFSRGFGRAKPIKPVAPLVWKPTGVPEEPSEGNAWRATYRRGDTRRTCGPGDVGVIPGGVEHEAWFPEDTEVIDVFAPPREDFFPGAGAPAYMRES